eukprot:366367-Chlamydomonas_euryale.AAC.23
MGMRSRKECPMYARQKLNLNGKRQGKRRGSKKDRKEDWNWEVDRAVPQIPSAPEYREHRAIAWQCEIHIELNISNYASSGRGSSMMLVRTQSHPPRGTRCCRHGHHTAGAPAGAALAVAFFGRMRPAVPVAGHVSFWSPWMHWLYAVGLQHLAGRQVIGQLQCCNRPADCRPAAADVAGRQSVAGQLQMPLLAGSYASWP